MYKCLSDHCKDFSVSYSDNWVLGSRATGESAETCLHCGEKLSKIDSIDQSRKTPLIKTAGCTPSSNQFTH